MITKAKQTGVIFILLYIALLAFTGSLLLAQPNPPAPPIQPQPAPPFGPPLPPGIMPQPSPPSSMPGPIIAPQPIIPPGSESGPVPGMATDPTRIGPPAPPKPTVKRGEVSFNFDDADVYSVIQTIFGGVMKFNYIIDPKVKGRVNFRSVAPVAKEDVLPLMEVILRLNGIGVIEEGGLYRIIPIGDMPREPAPVKIGREPDKVFLQGLGLLQVVPIRYITSTEMVRVLTPFLSTNALIVDVPKINYLILVDTDANVKRLLQLVEIFDSEQLKQVKPQVFVYPVQNAKAKDLSALLNQIFLGSKAPPRPTTPTTPTTPSRPGTTGQQPTPAPQPQITIGPSAGGEALVSEITRIYADEISNSLIILATPDDYALILETLKKVDIVPRQVMIEAFIAEITLDDELKFGLEWSLKSQVDKGFIGLSGGFTSSTAGDPPAGTVIPPTGFTFLGIDQTGLIRGYLQTLATQGKTNILASPHILAADNREAKIQIGDQVPVVTDVVGTVSTQTVQYKDTGVILKIKPSINDSGLVSMEISQEVSDYYYKAVSGTTQYPIITKREASTYMIAQDGQTIVIGGLIREKTGKTRSGLPFLSKIPILGYLFGYTKDTFYRSEIILLITPRVIRNKSEGENLTNIYIHRLDKSFKDQIKLEDKMNKDRPQ